MSPKKSINYKALNSMQLDWGKARDEKKLAKSLTSAPTLRLRASAVEFSRGGAETLGQFGNPLQ
jgi:hypothetical protein